MLLAPGTALCFFLSLAAALAPAPPLASMPQGPAGAVAAHVAAATPGPELARDRDAASAAQGSEAPGPGSPVPEPGTLLLVGTGLLCVTVTRRIRRRAVPLEQAPTY